MDARSMASLLAGALIGSSPTLARAQTPTTRPDAGTWSFQWENDLFAKGRTDRYYTNGLRLVYARSTQLLGETREGRGLIAWYANTAGSWLCDWGACDSSAALVSVDTHGGQNMYTPQNLVRRSPYPFDRPYAGWLYIGQRVNLVDRPDGAREGARRQSFDILIGVVGPAAGAGKVQEEWHRLTNSVDPQGWPNQLKNEIAVQASYTLTFRRPLTQTVDALPYGRITLGNVFTHAALGGQLRWGTDLSGFGHFDPAPSSIPFSTASANLETHRVQSASDRRAKSPSYVFVAFEGRANARNIFIDGNTFKNYPEQSSISREPLVGDITLGFSTRVLDGWRITYGHTWRSKEYRLDRRPPAFERGPQVQRYGVIQIASEH
jgi:lipid A 3-O-deacylase